MTTGTQLSCIHIVKDHAPPRLIKIHENSPRSRFRMPCPVHDGVDDNFHVSADGQLFKCWSCTAAGNARQLLRLLTGEQPHSYTPQAPVPKAAPTQSSKAFQGATLQSLALSKGPDADWLESFLGWKNARWYGNLSVTIPYYGEYDEPPLMRHRVGVDEGDRFRWEKFEGQKMRPYGVWNLEFARESASSTQLCYIVLVEGETDFASLLYHEIPVLGVPGADNWQKGWETYLAGIAQVYIWQEPGLACEKFVEKISATLYQGGYIINAPVGMEDPNEMAQQAGSGFVDMFLDLLQDALGPATAPVKPIATWGSEVGITSIEDANFPGSNDRREAVAAAYDYMGEHIAAKRIRMCAFYRRGFVFECGIVEGKPYHSNKKGCDTCARVRLSLFFTEKDENMKSLTEATIYKFPELMTWQLHLGDSDQNEKAFTSGFQAVGAAMTALSNKLGRNNFLAKNHIYCLQSKVVDGIVSFGVDILGSALPHDLEDLEAFFSGHFSRPVPITGRVVTFDEANNDEQRRQKAIKLFMVRAADNFGWETNEEFNAWKVSQKGKKAVQGKGIYYKVSGSKPTPEPQSDEPEVGFCPVHGIETFYKSKFIGGPEMWSEYHSRLTGKTHYLRKTGFTAEDMIYVGDS